jgi:hypothetical protein
MTKGEKNRGWETKEGYNFIHIIIFLFIKGVIKKNWLKRKGIAIIQYCQ